MLVRIMYTSYVPCPCQYGIVISNLFLKGITANHVHFTSPYLYSSHLCVPNHFNMLFLINFRLWYEGIPKYLGKSVTGLEIRI